MRNTGGGKEAASTFNQTEPRLAQLSLHPHHSADGFVEVVNTTDFHVPGQLYWSFNVSVFHLCFGYFAED